jgi:archaeosine synthase alpha-subunit
VLDILARDGRARVAQWRPDAGHTVTTPGLVFPDTTLASPPAWAEAVVTARDPPPGPFAIRSGGTWFHPLEPKEGLVLPAVATAPTSRVQLVAAGEELAAFHDAGGWANDPKAFLAAFIEARTKATPARLLWTPALGTPADYAIWAYLGADLFDASPLLLAAFQGKALTPDGALGPEEAARILGRPSPLTRDELVAFNLDQARAELERIRQAIHGGTLRALAERRAYVAPRGVEVLRRFDREHSFLEAAAPRHRSATLAALTAESLWMPEVEAFRRTFRDRWAPPRTARVLVILPCSQRKPYKTSRSHRAFARVLDDSGIRPLLHEVMVTSPLGLVPRELEETYPANRYDIPVTGHWMRDEEEIVRAQLASLLAKHRYDHVVVHAAPDTCATLLPLLPGAATTCVSHPTSREDLDRLAAELARLKGVLGPVQTQAARDRKLEDLRALASFQFGADVAAALTEGSHAAGHMPYVKLFGADGRQLATTTPDRGVLSLTLDGAAVLARHGRNRVYIQDFQPRKTSSLFAVGVDGADPEVRVGDEVVVVHRAPDGTLDVRGCGVAQMSAEEMGPARRGLAVTLRHTASAAPKAATVEVVAA